MNFNLLIKDIRTRKGMSQAEVAMAAGISRESYGAIERGTTDPYLSTVFKILEVLDCQMILDVQDIT